MPPHADELDLKGVDTPPKPTTPDIYRDAEEIPIGARLAPRKPALKKPRRRDIAQMVVDDYDRDWKAWSEWRDKRADVIERFIMKPVPKTEPFEGAANLRLPTIMIAVFPTQARMMASVYGNDPAVKVKGVNATGRENKIHAESLLHWDARVKDGGDYELLESASNCVTLDGGVPIYTFWDQDIRFVQDAVDVYVSDLTGEVFLDPTTDEPLLIPGNPPIVPLQDGTNAILKRKVIERERVVYDAPRSIALDPEDFLTLQNGNLQIVRHELLVELKPLDIHLLDAV